MLKSLSKSIRHGATAIVLLLLLVMIVEGVMQWQTGSSHRLICDHVCSEQQSLLVPSPTLHHDNPRIDEVTIEDVTYRFDGSGFRIDSNAIAKQRESETVATASRQRLPTVQKSGTGKVIVAVLGDERVFGVGLKDEDCVTSRLQWFLNSDPRTNVNVINAAVPGYCPLLSLLKYRQDVRTLRPDIVVLHIDFSDIADDSVFRRYLRKDSASGAVCIHPDLKNTSGPENRFFQIMNESKLAGLARIQLTEANSQVVVRKLTEQYEWTVQSELSPTLATRIRHALQPVAELAEAVHADGGTLILSSSPVPWQVGSVDKFPELVASVPRHVWSEPGSASALLQAMSNKLQIPLCDASNSFAGFSQPEKLYQSGTVELSRFGALLYSRELAEFLSRQSVYQRLRGEVPAMAVGPNEFLEHGAGQSVQN